MKLPAAMQMCIRDSVGTGVERELGISKEKMNQALYILEMEGYHIYGCLLYTS